MIPLHYLACCCCSVASVVSNSVQPHRGQPTRLPGPWDSPGKNTGVGCHFLLQWMKVKSESKSLSRVQLSATPWTAAHQAPPSMGFSRHEYWSGVPLPWLTPNQTTRESVWLSCIEKKTEAQRGWVFSMWTWSYLIRAGSNTSFILAHGSVKQQGLRLLLCA